MGSDRARLSHDPSRHWRGVVNQQGRVTLEADWNEAATIAAEEDREQLLDVIGPSGTPDDGYRVIPVTDAEGTATGDLTIQHGTLYVGGERMVLDDDLDYAQQADWIDRLGDPLWQAPAIPVEEPDEAVYLLMREQEVGAVEDPALLDIALGGPDTAGRLRILQRVVRRATDQTSCSGALGQLEQEWAALGLQFDPATMRLSSQTSLQVSFQEAGSGPTPCQPFAQGGYLGAENQLIRVQVASVDGNGVPTLVWGFDNAYFLYRVAQHSAGEAGTTTLTLASAPVDEYHQPAKGQAVEVLQAAAALTDKDYIAASSGIVTTLAAAYQPDTQQVVISTELEPPTTESPLLFLRVWQEEVVYQGSGPVSLGDTGLQVTLSSSSGVYHVGDYWEFAVRPGTPSTVSPVYPERMLDAPQPPNGPRLWAAPLAVLAWEEGSPTVSDCRGHFENLTTLTGATGGCCTVEVSPADVGGGATLQAVIDRYADQGPTTICLGSGRYALPAPLVIDSNYSHLTLQGCENGAVLAAEGPSESFLLGLIMLEGPTDFTLRGLELEIPFARFSFDKEAVIGLPQERQALLEAYGRELGVSIGVYALGGTDISIEGCTFTFDEPTKGNLFGVGVFGTRAIAGLKILDCSFTAPESPTVPFSQLTRGVEADPPYQVRFGYLQVPTRSQEVNFRSLASRLSAKKAQAAAEQIGLPSLTDAVVEHNLFDGLTVPALVIGQVGGVRIEENTVRSCYGGFWLLTASTTALLALLDRLEADSGEMWKLLVAEHLTALADPVLLFASVLGRVLPLRPPSSHPASEVGRIPLPSIALLDAAREQFAQLYALTDGAAQAAAGQAAAAQATKPSSRAKRTAAATRAKPRQALAPLPPAISDVFKSPDYAEAGDLVPEADPGTALVARLDVSANQIDAVIADADSAAGLLVVVLDRTGTSSLICTGNRVRSRVALGATVSLWALFQCTLTGNILSNEIVDAEDDQSIVLKPRLSGKVAAVAVTGNVLIGPVVLPPRPNPAPLASWNELNTVLTYTP